MAHYKPGIGNPQARVSISGTQWRFPWDARRKLFKKNVLSCCSRLSKPRSRNPLSLAFCPGSGYQHPSAAPARVGQGICLPEPWLGLPSQPWARTPSTPGLSGRPEHPRPWRLLLGCCCLPPPNTALDQRARAATGSDGRRGW